jgi:hypothetical protein
VVVRQLAPSVLLVLLMGCGTSVPQTAGDCSLAVRRGGVVYVEAGFVRASAQPAGQADHADCDDNGEDAGVPTSRSMRSRSMCGHSTVKIHGPCWECVSRRGRFASSSPRTGMQRQFCVP